MMQNRATEDHKLWLFDLAHGNLSDSEIVRGFVKYYALNGLTVGNVQDDIIFKTHYEPETAVLSLRTALEQFIED
ncbi:MAG: hypothetical protein LIO94_02305 [Clostridiales bacterium]|nr:hypothetical protein [Clostridiales bacterium]